MSKKQKRREKKALKRRLKAVVAHHECGHVVQAWFEPVLPAIDKVTIKSSENALGYARISFDKRYWSLADRDVHLALIRWLLGGMIAEKLCFGTHGPGPWHDMTIATAEAATMVSFYGMDDELGPMSLAGLLGVSEKTLERVDSAVERTLRACYAETERSLKKRLPLLKKLAAELLKRKTLKTKDIRKILGPRKISNARRK